MSDPPPYTDETLLVTAGDSPPPTPRWVKAFGLVALGLFRHWWVVIKLVMTVLATAILVAHMQPVGHLADAVAAATLAGGELRGLRVQLLADAGAAIVVLLIATTLSIVKPRGLTRYGWRQQQRAAMSQ